MLQPKRTKFRKQQKGRIGRIAQRGHTLCFGTYGIKAVEAGQLTSRQIEAARVAIVRTMVREGVMWRRIFPDKAITKKPSEVRMGKGKGHPEGFVALVKPGTIMFEADGVDEKTIRRAFRMVGNKLPIKTKIVVADDQLDI